MSNQVYANNMEVSCKQAAGKSICAFPDVCFTPPLTPATPPGVPIPYPNTGMASDTTDGSTSVKISGQEVMLKNKSFFKKSMGDEAGSAPKKGVVTSKNMGKVYFSAWSMDVKAEGENIVRNLDITTHNHGSVPGNTPVWPYLDEVAAPGIEKKCTGDMKKEKEACKDYTPHGSKDPCGKAELGIAKKPKQTMSSPEPDALADHTAASKCLAARRCALQPYKSTKSHCCQPQTGHHLIEASALHNKGRGGNESIPVKGMLDYSENMAPCVCAEGTSQNVGTHALMHTYQSAAAAKCKVGDVPLSDGSHLTGQKSTTYKDAKASSIESMKKAFPESGCDEECLAAQLDAYHNQCGIKDDTVIKAVETGQTDVSAADKSVADRSARVIKKRALDDLE